MSGKKTNYIIERGQPPLERKYGESVPFFKFMIPDSQHAYVKQCAEDAGISAAEYLRQLIEADMQKQRQGGDET